MGIEKIWLEDEISIFCEYVYQIHYENKNELDCHILFDDKLSNKYVDYTGSVVWI